MVGSSCSTGGTHRANIVRNPVIIHESGKDREMLLQTVSRGVRGMMIPANINITNLKGLDGEF